MDERRYDVIVIGGGVNGTGLARDCALRGFKTLLVEKSDFGGGTTGASSCLIHGGARYLLYDVHTTKIACLDSGYIQKIAPHLLFRIPFLYLVFKGEKPHIDLLETFFEVYDRYSPLRNGKRHTRLSREEVLELEPGIIPHVSGAISFDEWAIDPYRLCVLNVLSAKEASADIHNHEEVTSFIWEGRRVIGIEVQDPITFKKTEFYGKMIVNLSGPWVTQLGLKAGVNVKIRPGKGIHIVLDRRLSQCGILTRAIDNRSVFILPYQNTSLIGTTDDDYYGSPDHIETTQDEIEYLMQAIEKVFPAVQSARPIRTFAGIRPTLFQWGPLEDELSRNHEIYDHESRDGIPGLISVAGGKLASYRLLSEEIADKICRKLRVKAGCQTHRLPLAGVEIFLEERERISKELGISLFATERIYFRHGGRARDIFQRMRDNPMERRAVCQTEPVLEAEVRYCCQKEWVRTLGDLARRTRLALGPCCGSDCLFKAAQIVEEEAGGDRKKIICAYLQEGWQGIFPYLQGISVAQEELRRLLFLEGAELDVL